MGFTELAKQEHARLTKDRKYVHARLLAKYATEDYLLAREGLLRGHLAAFATAHQALEKYLKSYLLHSGKAASLAALKAEIRRRAPPVTGLPSAHNLVGLFSWATDAREPVPGVLELLNRIYIERYPDNPRQPGAYSTSDLQAVDELVFKVWGWHEQYQPYLFLTHGPFIYAFATLSDPKNIWSKLYLPVLKNRNTAYKAALALAHPKMALLLEAPVLAPGS